MFSQSVLNLIEWNCFHFLANVHSRDCFKKQFENKRKVNKFLLKKYYLTLGSTSKKLTCIQSRHVRYEMRWGASPPPSSGHFRKKKLKILIFFVPIIFNINQFYTFLGSPPLLDYSIDIVCFPKIVPPAAVNYPNKTGIHSLENRGIVLI